MNEDLVFSETDEGVKWYLNEEGEPYPYPAHLQAEHYPNDLHTAYDSEREAEDASLEAEESFREYSLNADIYEYLDNGGSVHNDIKGMSIPEMEDYFGDLDPAEFL